MKATVTFSLLFVAMFIIVSFLGFFQSTAYADHCGDPNTYPNIAEYNDCVNNHAPSGSDCEADKKATILGIPKWYKYLEVEEDASGRCSPILSWTDDENKTEQQVNSVLPIGIVGLEILLRLGGLVAVVMIFWGAFKYILSQGDPEKATSARKTVINSIIGLIIIMISTGLVSFLGASLGNTP